MNKKAIKIIRNASYSVTSNVVSLLVSALVTLIIPKFIGIQMYGYLQLYVLYTSYVGIFHLGWLDGIYLRQGGMKYSDIDKRLFFFQFMIFLIMQIIIAIAITAASLKSFVNIDKLFIIQMTALVIVISNSRSMFQFILLATNRIKEYAILNLSGRLGYLILMSLLLVFGIRDYKLMITSDIIGVIISLFIALIYCRTILLQGFRSFYIPYKEIMRNIKVGMKLMVANFSSMLIMGNVRLGIENSWDVETFGKVSLSLSISNLLMVLINALGVILFPILRRMEENKITELYYYIRDILMILLLGILIIYYPFKTILSMWLPEYSTSLKYIIILLPICIYEGKIILLINTYLKTLRKESVIFKINLLALGTSLITTYLTTFLLKNLDLAILSILFIISLKCFLAELYLMSILGNRRYKDIALEGLIVACFILVNWFIDSWSAVFIYVIIYVLYLYIKRGDIVNLNVYIKKIFVTT